MVNWVDKLDLICKSDAEIGMVGAAFFLGLFIGLFIVPPLGEKYGRKKVFGLTIRMSLVVQILMVFSQSFNLTLFTIFASGVLWNGKNIVGLSYAEEFLPKKHSKDVITGMFVIGSVCMFVVPLYFITISNNWVPIGIMMVIWTLISVIIMPNVPESPKFLYEKGEFNEARLSLFSVARFNGVKIKQNLMFDKENPDFKQQMKVFSSSDLQFTEVV